MSDTFRAEGYEEKQTELGGWPVRIVSYKLKDDWRCEIDNVSPGAKIARATGPTREAAIEKATAKATERLGRQRTFST
jgi:hypothetical protein